MKRDAAEILKDALALPTEARAALAGSLLESLDTEVKRRVAELDSGAVKSVSWAELRRRLHRVDGSDLRTRSLARIAFLAAS
jgi:hypothetical protein